MKYRVKFRCYWYNTGAADNHYYIENEDFDTLEEAEKFKLRVDIQKDIEREEYSVREAWYSSEDAIKIENGFIEGYATIVKYYPEREEVL